MRSAHSRSALVGSIEVLSGRASVGNNDDNSMYSPDEGDVSQGTVSLLDISVSNDEDTRKRKARKVAHKNDTDFVAWKDKLISDGTTGLQEWDNVVHDYADGKRKPKSPDSLGPLVSCMEERGVFKPLPSTTNLLGLCRFTMLIQQLCLRFKLWSHQLRWTISRVCLFSPRHSLIRISSLCS